ncbi:MAG: hypothetical protein ACKPKO_51045, partial [Candidatus Fonsibacter sp.]
NFAEVGSARVQKALGEAYMVHKLHFAGYTPVPDPGERADKSRKLVKALFEKPMKTLHMNADGYLLVHTLDEVCQILHMREMTNETKALLKRWQYVFLPSVIAQRSSSS